MLNFMALVLYIRIYDGLSVLMNDTTLILSFTSNICRILIADLLRVKICVFFPSMMSPLDCNAPS